MIFSGMFDRNPLSIRHRASVSHSCMDSRCDMTNRHACTACAPASRTKLDSSQTTSHNLSNTSYDLFVENAGVWMHYPSYPVIDSQGFLIIPALVLFAGLSMKKAVATSLLIISAKSLFGFIGDIGQNNIDWGFLFFFTFLSIIGIFVGIYLNRFIEGAKLKKLFAWFIIVIAVYIIGMELIV